VRRSSVAFAQAPGSRNRAAALSDGRQLRPLDRFREYGPLSWTDPIPRVATSIPPISRTSWTPTWIAHPEEKDALLSFTVVRRDHHRWWPFLSRGLTRSMCSSCGALEEACKAQPRTPSLTKYLQCRRTRCGRRVLRGELAWLDLDSRLDLSIGAHET